MGNGKDQTGSEAGIYYGYTIVAISFFLITVMWGVIYCYGVFFEPLRTEFGWTSAQTSGAFSLYMVLHGSFYITTGRLNDRFGPRVVMTACGLLLGIGYFLMSQVDAIWQLYLIYGLIIGIGMSGGLVPLTSTVARWFTKRRSLMTGICTAGVGAGTMIMPPIANWLISSYGWRSSFIVIGVISLVLIVLLSQFLKRSPAEMREPTNETEEIKQESTNLQAEGLSLRQVIRTRQFWLLCAMFFGLGFYQLTIMVHIVPYARNLEPPLANPALILTVIGALNIIGRVLMGATGDRIGNRVPTAIGFALMFGAACLLIMSRGMWILYLFGAIFGFAYGGLIALESPLIADLFGLHSHGTIFGIIHFLVTIGGAAGPFLTGYIFDLTNSYHISFMALTIISAISLALMLLLRPTSYQRWSKEPQSIR